jgi:elongation factor Ts
MITASMVKELREKTGAGMMDCKKVLTEADGDMEKAAELLRERGIAKAGKKAGRVAAEGLVASYVTDDKKVGAIVEVNAETDFVAKNDEFKSFVNDIAKIVATSNPADVQSLLASNYAGTEKTVEEVLKDKIYTIGENMTIRRFARFESAGLVESYIHGEGKIAVLVDMASGNSTVAKDVCMQIAAARPEFLNESEVPAERVEKEMEILKAQAMNEGKPAEIAEKMVKGRIGKFYGEICLVDQVFVKDGNQKVSEMLKANNAEVTRFARFEKGEGIEKKEENFAEEVMKQLQ